MAKKISFWLALGLMVVVLGGQAWAAIPPQITFQGRLLKTDGSVEPGPKSVKFFIHETETAIVGATDIPARSLWFDTISVDPNNETGIFTQILGSAANPIPSSAFDGENRYIGIIIDTEELATNGNRQKLTSVPYSFRAEKANTATSADSATTATTANNLSTTANVQINSLGIGTVAPGTAGNLAVAGDVSVATGKGITLGNVYKTAWPTFTDTDNQSLSLSGSSLSIDRGNGVTFTGWDTNAADDVTTAGGMNITGGLNIATTSGNVGIGTTGPQTKLQTNSDWDGTNWSIPQFSIRGYTNSNKILSIGYDTTNNLGRIQAGWAGTDWSNLALQPSGGNVGIGTTDPSVGKLTIFGSYDSAYLRPNTIFLGDSTNANLKGYIGLNRNSAAGVDKEYLGIEAVEEGVHWMNIALAVNGGNVGIGTATPTTIIGTSPLFPSKTPKTEILTGSSAGAYEELVTLRHTAVDVNLVTRRLGFLMKMSSEGSIGESNKMGGMVLESTNDYANWPALHLVTNNQKRMTITAELGNVGIGTASMVSGALLTVNGSIAEGGTLLSAKYAAKLAAGEDYLNTTSTAQTKTGGLNIATTTGNVGIGTASPEQKLHLAATGGWPATSDTTQNGTLRIQGNPSLYSVLDFGVATIDPYPAWLQCTSKNALGNYRPLLLNPNGGNVGIGTTAPGTKLDVNGVITATGGTSTNWNTAYGWGNHASAGYITDGNTNWDNSYSYITAGSTLTGLVQSTTSGNSYFTGGNVGIGTAGPGAKLHVQEVNPVVRLENTSAGTNILSRTMPGLELSTKDMDASTYKYGYPIKFISTDPAFTSENPKFLAAIIPRATEPYASDSRGGMALDFATTPNVPGATSVPTVRMTISEFGSIGIGTTNPDASDRLTVKSAGNTLSHYGLKVQDSGGTNQFVVRSDGNVGIGTTGPQTNLQVNTTSGNSAIYIRPGTELISETAYLNVNKRARFGYDGARTAIVIDDKDLTGTTATKPIVFDNAGSERLRINTSGNVGIGTTEAAKLLTLGTNTADNNVLRLYYQSPAYTGIYGDIYHGGNDEGLKIVAQTDAAGNAASGDIRFYTSSSGLAATEKVRIRNDGNVGIGMAAPNEKLEVGGNIHLSGGDRTIFNRSDNYLALGTNNIERLRITNAGRVAIGMTTLDANYMLQLPNYSYTKAKAYAWDTYSSIRWKENIQPINDALSKVVKLRGVYFDWKSDKKHDIGLIAEEVGQVIPEVVSYEDNGKDASGLNYDRLTAVLVEAIKEQQKEIGGMRAEIAEMKAKLKN